MDPPFLPIKVEPDFESTPEEIIMEENFEDSDNPENMVRSEYTVSKAAGNAERLMESLFVPIKAEPDFESTSEETIIQEKFEASEFTEEYSKGIKEESHIENNTASSSSGTPTTLSQSLSTKVIRMTNENICSKNTCISEPGPKLLESQEAFPIASTSTTDSIEDEEEDAGGYLSWHGEVPEAAFRRKEQSDQSEDGGGDSNQGTIPTHMSERPFTCSQCGKAFMKKNKLVKHVTTHSREKRFQCHHCEMSFAQSNNLTHHLRTHTGEEPYKCNQCGRAFKRSDVLTKHMRIHSGEKPFKCGQCDMSFTQSWNLTIHLRSHTGEEPYKCTHCGKSFKRSDTLTAHVRTHTGEKPYKCLQCGMSFTCSSNLTVHSRTHTGDEPYKCEQCGKTFRTSGTLTTHMRTHSGEKPFKCPQCGKLFTQSSTLTRHFRNHDEEKPH